MASKIASNYQNLLLPTILGINNQAQRGLGQLHSCRNSHGISHSYTNGSKIFPMTQFTEQLQRSPNSCQLAKKGLSLQDNLTLLILAAGRELPGSNYIRATNQTGHKTLPRDHLPEPLQASTQGRFVRPLRFLRLLPSQILPQPSHSSSSSSVQIFKDAKQSGFTYGIISWLLPSVKEAETSAGRRRSGAGKAV